MADAFQSPLAPNNGGTGASGDHAIPSDSPRIGGRGADVPWRVYKAWFWAAAAYNLAWGTLIGLKPGLLLDWMGMTPGQQAGAGPLPGILAACIGMFVGVYAIGYLCVALDPARFWPFALLGLCGKVLGPLGWALHHALGHLPWRALWVNVFNDFLWWPAFAALLLTVWRESRAGRMQL